MKIRKSQKLRSQGIEDRVKAALSNEEEGKGTRGVELMLKPILIPPKCWKSNFLRNGDCKGLC